MRLYLVHANDAQNVKEEGRSKCLEAILSQIKCDSWKQTSYIYINFNHFNQQKSISPYQSFFLSSTISHKTRITN